MTGAPALPRRPGGSDDPGEDLRLARIHLRMGQLVLARAELEDLLGRDALDNVGLAVLAEARWRTGDADGAALAAEAHLEAGGVDAIAVCIAAEAAAAEGRPDEARGLMELLPAADAAALDALFAGMPRRAHWPAAPVDRSELDEIRREAEARGSRGGPRGEAHRGHRGTLADAPTQVYRPDATAQRAGIEPANGAPAPGTHAGPGGAGAPAGGPSRAVPGPREVLEAAGAWDDVAAQLSAAKARERAAAGAAGGRHAKAQLEPLAELEHAREELGTRPERALLRLALVLRADPTLAPAVLDAIRLRREPLAALLRGDAERLLGRHLEAEAAFDAAAESLEH